MKPAFALVFAFLAINAALAPARTSAAEPGTIALRAARMLNPMSGEVTGDATVVVEGEKIIAAGADVPVPVGAKIIDLGDMILLPGLIDCHVHLQQNLEPGEDENEGAVYTAATRSPAQSALLGVAMGREVLEAGITSVRELGNPGGTGDVALREAIEAGWIVGPRIFAATRVLAPTGGQSNGLVPEAHALIEQRYRVVKGAEDARQAVREAFYDGADLIKVVVNAGPRVLSQAEVDAIVDEAHRVGRKVTSHATTELSTRIAAAAGVDSIEHGYIIPDDALQMMARKGIYLVATDYPADFYMAIFAADTRTPEDRERLRSSVQQYVDSIQARLQRALRLGVRIAFGSDEYFNIPGQTRGETSLLCLQAYQAAGMSPLEVIRAATVNAADLLGEQDRLGTIAAGKLADIIAVAGDPLTDVTDMQRVRFVMKNGQIVRNDAAREAKP